MIVKGIDKDGFTLSFDVYNRSHRLHNRPTGGPSGVRLPHGGWVPAFFNNYLLLSF